MRHRLGRVLLRDLLLERRLLLRCVLLWSLLLWSRLRSVLVWCVLLRGLGLGRLLGVRWRVLLSRPVVR